MLRHTRSDAQMIRYDTGTKVTNTLMVPLSYPLAWNYRKHSPKLIQIYIVLTIVSTE